MITQGMIAVLILVAIGIGIAFAIDSDYASKRFKQMARKLARIVRNLTLV